MLKTNLAKLVVGRGPPLLTPPPFDCGPDCLKGICTFCSPYLCHFFLRLVFLCFLRTSYRNSLSSFCSWPSIDYFLFYVVLVLFHGYRRSIYLRRNGIRLNYISKILAKSYITDCKLVVLFFKFSVSRQLGSKENFLN